MATVLAMLAESRKAIAAGKTEEGLELLTWAETELARHMEVNVAVWKRAAG
jgi:phage terminase Nu1 subunit (DNA packaging protein)